MPRPARRHLNPVHDLPDHAIRALLENPDNVRDLMEEAAPELVPHLDFARMRIVQRDFALEDWRERQNDLYPGYPLPRPGSPPALDLHPD